MQITRYIPSMAAEWDAFVRTSKNGTFMLERAYMDYHADRFEDFSLLFRDEHGRLVAVLPANRVADTLYSHQGLTYGGLIMSARHCTAAVVMQIFEEMNAWLRGEGFARVVYKAIPHIYHKYPAEEDLFALDAVCHARLASRRLSSTIRLDRRLPFRQNRRTALNHARREGIEVRWSLEDSKHQDLEAFWNILDANLRRNHGVEPVHSMEELRLLADRFPDNISLMAAYKEGILVAGAVVYSTDEVLHTQYIAANEYGKRAGAIDMIFERMLNETEARWLDIGISPGDHGEPLNLSLMFQKEGFGARGICYDTYDVIIDN